LRSMRAAARRPVKPCNDFLSRPAPSTSVTTASTTCW
jgi:hypothetical protein